MATDVRAYVRGRDNGMEFVRRHRRRLSTSDRIRAAVVIDFLKHHPGFKFRASYEEQTNVDRVVKEAYYAGLISVDDYNMAVKAIWNEGQ